MVKSTGSKDATAEQHILNTRILSDRHQLRSIRNPTRCMGRTALRGVDGGLPAERNRASGADSQVTHKRLRIDPFKLALEKAVEFAVLRGGLAVRDGKGVGRVARLLGEDLSELDHLLVVLERLRKVDHGVRCILLVAVPASSEESREGGDRKRVALVCAASSELSIELEVEVLVR